MEKRKEIEGRHNWRRGKVGGRKANVETSTERGEKKSRKWEEMR